MRNLKFLKEYECRIIEKLRNQIKELKKHNPEIKNLRLKDISITLTFEQEDEITFTDKSNNNKNLPHYLN
jgi:hypothetical protein